MMDIIQSLILSLQCLLIITPTGTSFYFNGLIEPYHHPILKQLTTRTRTRAIMTTTTMITKYDFFPMSFFVGRRKKRSENQSFLNIPHSSTNDHHDYDSLDNTMNDFYEEQEQQQQRCKDDTISTNNNNNNNNNNCLEFTAQTVITTEPMNICTSKDITSSLLEFFQMNEHRNVLLTSTTNNDDRKTIKNLINKVTKPKKKRLKTKTVTQQQQQSSSSSQQQQSPSIVRLMNTNDINSKKLFNKWYNESKRSNYIIEPNPFIDELVIIENKNIPFAMGLIIHVESIMGMKLVHHNKYDKNNKYPFYQFVLLEDNVWAEGPSSLVWMFNKIMMKGKQQQQHQESFNTRSVATIRPIDVITTTTTTKTTYQDNNNENINNDHYDKNIVNVTTTLYQQHQHHQQRQIAFQAKSQIGITIPLPSFLIRCLPMNVEQCNHMGSTSLQKYLESRLEISLKLFATTFHHWWMSSSLSSSSCGGSSYNNNNNNNILVAVSGDGNAATSLLSITPRNDTLDIGNCNHNLDNTKNNNLESSSSSSSSNQLRTVSQQQQQQSRMKRLLSLFRSSSSSSSSSEM